MTRTQHDLNRSLQATNEFVTEQIHGLLRYGSSSEGVDKFLLGPNITNHHHERDTKSASLRPTFPVLSLRHVKRLLGEKISKQTDLFTAVLTKDTDMLRGVLESLHSEGELICVCRSCIIDSDVDASSIICAMCRLGFVEGLKILFDMAGQECFHELSKIRGFKDQSCLFRACIHSQKECVEFLLDHLTVEQVRDFFHSQQEEIVLSTICPSIFELLQTCD
mmetsp:Transcript_6178/g.23366  ORF Transcript_6178/g.23366 Transcript_6178/m.23366 type:complete len:221 (-) Transcript_6178:93-755(-)